MTAPLPEAVESHIEFCRSMAIPQEHPCWGALRAAILAALATPAEAATASVERQVAEAVKAERARLLDADLVAAIEGLTDAERAVLPLNVQEDARPRVKLAHIESDDGAPAGQGTPVVSVPAKYARLAWAMVCAINAAIRARGAEGRAT